MEILEKIKSQIAEFDAKRQALLGELKNDFAPMVKPLFEKHPKIKSFSWAQYTPYFNDGEECTFGTHIDYPDVNGESVEEMDALNKIIHYPITEENISFHREFNESGKGYNWYKDKKVGETGAFPNNDLDVELQNGVDEFKSLLKSIPESFLKDLFGDHIKVTLTADGLVETEEYEHD